MQGLLVSTIAAACVLAMSNVCAAPQDPARVGATPGDDPAAVFASPAPSSAHGSSLASQARALAPQGGTLDRVMQQASGALNKFGMSAPSDDDYRAAYGNANVRERLGRTYNAGGSGNDYGGGQSSSWLGGLLQSGESAVSGADWSGNAQSLQGTMDGFSRELMPALRNLRDSVSEGLDRAASQNRQR